MIVDAHHHFWHYTPEEYGWIDEPMKSIRRDYLPLDLKQTIATAGVDGVVTVQARQSVAETDQLLQMASENDFIRGTVGWLPLCSDRIGEYLQEYSANPFLKGLRHVVQGEPDPEFLLRDDFNRGISLLKAHGLTYDILIVEHQLPATIRFVDRHPDQPFVVDHIAKPLIAKGITSPWKEQIAELAKRPNVCCKLSGLVTEADYRHWTPEQLQPYFDTIIESFGPQRLMFGSDWPVCLVATTYSKWVALVKDNIGALSEAEQQQIMGGNAISFYKL